MQLGDAVQITIGTTEDIKGEAFFYDRLGYQELSRGDDPVPWVALSDGGHRYLVAEEEEAYRGISYFARDMRERVRDLAERRLLMVDQEIEEATYRATFFSPNQVAVTLIEQDPETLPAVDESFEFRGGKFGEYSVAVEALGEAIAFWQRLGFERLHESAEPYPWALLGDGLLVLGLHQTDQFSGQAITYFAPDMGERIAALKQDGFDFVEEMAEEDATIENAILHTPDDQKIFFFWGDI